MRPGLELPTSRLLGVVAITLIAASCTSLLAQSEEASQDTLSFIADGIDHNVIQFIWLEVGKSTGAGDYPVRLFIARLDPPEPIIPETTNLQCMPASPNEFLELAPITISFTFVENGDFEGSYQWYSCPECVECYMSWYYTMLITGTISKEKANIIVEIIHPSHNVRDTYLSVELFPVKNNGREPRMKCNSQRECKKIMFVRRR